MKAAFALVFAMGCAVDTPVEAPTATAPAGAAYLEIQFTDTSVARPDGVDAQLWVTVGRLAIERDAGPWLAVATAPMRFDLFAVEHGDASVVASARLASGGYPSLALEIDSAELVIEGVSTSVTIDGGAIELPLSAQLAGGDANALVLDFDAGKSLQMPPAPPAPAKTSGPPNPPASQSIVLSPAITVASFGEM